MQEQISRPVRATIDQLLRVGVFINEADSSLKQGCATICTHRSVASARPRTEVSVHGGITAQEKRNPAAV